jgi:hypothetical protein
MEHAVEIMAEVEEIEEIEHTFGNPEVEFESLDVAEECEFIADPPEDGALHEGAIDGRYRGASKRPVRQAVKRELLERIDDGEIDVTDLLGVDV